MNTSGLSEAIVRNIQAARKVIRDFSEKVTLTETEKTILSLELIDESLQFFQKHLNRQNSATLLLAVNGLNLSFEIFEIRLHAAISLGKLSQEALAVFYPMWQNLKKYPPVISNDCFLLT